MYSEFVKLGISWNSRFVPVCHAIPEIFRVMDRD